MTAGGYVATALTLAGVALYSIIPVQHLVNDARLAERAAEPGPFVIICAGPGQPATAWVNWA